MMLVKSCCCNYTLRTGSMIIAYVQLIALTITLITLLAVTPSYDTNEHIWYQDQYSHSTKYSTVPKDWPLNDVFVLSDIFVGFLMVISIILVVGATKGNMWLLLPWISNTTVGLIFSLIGWIYGLAQLGGGPVASLLTFTFFFLSGFNILSLLVVFSHFEELRKELFEGRLTNEMSPIPKPKDVEARVAALESMVETLGRVV